MKKKSKVKEITNQEESAPERSTVNRSNSVSDNERTKFKAISKNTLNFPIAEEESVCRSEGSPQKVLKKTRTFKQLVK